MSFKPDVFYAALKDSIFGGTMTQQQVDGTNYKLNAWAQFTPHADVRHIAYSLATAYHETGHTMWPIAEYGCGAGRKYGAACGPYNQVYYGRGDVQLTWEANYIKATERLIAKNLMHPSVDLHKDPDYALSPSVAAPILILGMSEGWFTGKCLADYFNDSTDDPVEARRIVNGTDRASLIAGYHQGFLDALKAAA